MTNSKKHTKRALLSSALSLLLCITMLIGTTWAWFTDSVTSAGNIIKSGTLDVEMSWADGKENPDSATWKDASTGAIFDYDLWEPGYVQVRHVKIANVGTLALKYTFNIVANGTLTTNTNGHTLADAIDVYYLDPAEAITNRTDLPENKIIGRLSDVLTNMASIDSTAQGILYPSQSIPLNGKSQEKITIALKMREDAGNEYQNMTLGTDFSVQLLATQYTYEADSFDHLYDEFATVTATSAYSTTSNTTITNGSTNIVGNAKVIIPAGTAVADGINLEDGENIKLIVEESDTPSSYVAIDENNGTTTYDVSLETESGAKITSNGEAFTVELNIGIVDLFGFAHNSTPLTKVDSLDQLENDKYYYDQTTGIITFMTTSFSPFTAEYRFSGGIGSERYPYILSGMKDWKTLSACSTTSSGLANKGYSFSITSDLDFSDLTTRESLLYFSGSLDFNGHSMTGINDDNVYRHDARFNYTTRGYGGLIINAGNTTISNLDYYVSSSVQDHTNKIICNPVGNVRLVFRNVDTYGFANLNDNNAGIYVYTCQSTAFVGLYDCTNYATMMNSNCFTGVFIGRSDKCPEFVFENVTNEGNIYSLPSNSNRNTGVFIANVAAVYGPTTVTFTNCVNNGNVFYTAGTTNLALGGPGASSNQLTVVGDITNNGTIQKVSYTPLTLTGSYFNTSAITGAEEYQVAFSFVDADGVHGGTVSIAFNPTQEELANNAIPAYRWIGESELPEGVETDTVTLGGTTIKTYTDNGTTYFVYNWQDLSTSFKTQPMLTMRASKADGSFQIYTYTYPAN